MAAVVTPFTQNLAEVLCRALFACSSHWWSCRLLSASQRVLMRPGRRMVATTAAAISVTNGLRNDRGVSRLEVGQRGGHLPDRSGLRLRFCDLFWRCLASFLTVF